VRGEKIHEGLEHLRGRFLQWGTPDLMVFTTTKDELRGWIRALEWVLGKTATDTKVSWRLAAVHRSLCPGLVGDRARGERFDDRRT